MQNRHNVSSRIRDHVPCIFHHLTKPISYMAECDMDFTQALNGTL
jgi:hypothetical protein